MARRVRTRRHWVAAALATLMALVLLLAGCATGDDVADQDVGVADQSVGVDESGTMEAAPFEEREVAVFRDQLTRETIPLRFYEDQPNVAYVSPVDFYALVLPQGAMSMERRQDGTWLLVSDTGADSDTVMERGAGGEAIVDIQAGTLTSPDLAAFVNTMSLMQDGMANAYSDGVPYAHVSAVEYDREPSPVTIDFSAYGIRLYEDADGVYLPFQTTSMIFSNMAYDYATFNGEKVYVNNDNYLPAAYVRDATYYDPILAVDERPRDLIDYSYAHLCLAIDYFYGRPDTQFQYFPELEEGGFDGLLTSLGDTGAAVRRALMSEDVARYLAGVEAVGLIMYDGGHSVFLAEAFTDLELNEERTELAEKYQSLAFGTDDEIGSAIRELYEQAIPAYVLDCWSEGIAKLRDDAFGDATYVTEGDTAVIVLDSFNGFDTDGWRAFLAGDASARPSATEPYNDEGAIDSVAIFLDGLARAEADPQVRNVVVDISNNTGGSLDVMAFLSAAITGNSTFRFENVLEDVTTSETYEIDLNLDGVFDERDKGPLCPDLRFGIVTSIVSFSCGNIFPSCMKDEGILVMGARSGGGGCAVEHGACGEGMLFQMSSWLGRCVDKDGRQIDAGVEPDIDLVERFGKGASDLLVTSGNEDEGTGPIVATGLPDYSVLYDVSLLSQTMNEYYDGAALADVA